MKKCCFLWSTPVQNQWKIDIKPMPLGVQCSSDLEIWNLISKCISAFKAGSIDNGYWFLSRLIFFSIKTPSLSFYLSKSKLKYCNPHLRTVCFMIGGNIAFNLHWYISSRVNNIQWKLWYHGEDLIWYNRNIKRGYGIRNIYVCDMYYV